MPAPTPFQPKKPKTLASDFPAEFAIGSLVKMRSGGCLMTITAHLMGEPPAVHVEWLDTGYGVQERSFPIVCLRAATETEVAATYDEADGVCE